MNADPQKPTKPGNVRLRIWNFAFVCAQMIVVTLLVVFSVQESLGNKYIDGSSYPISAAIVAVLSLAMPLFLVIAGPFFWKRLVSAGTGFAVGVIGFLYFDFLILCGLIGSLVDWGESFLVTIISG